MISFKRLYRLQFSINLRKLETNFFLTKPGIVISVAILYSPIKWRH